MERRHLIIGVAIAAAAAVAVVGYSVNPWVGQFGVIVLTAIAVALLAESLRRRR